MLAWPSWLTSDIIQFVGWLAVSVIMWMMILKVWMPFSPKVEGEPVLHLPLSLRQRMLLHRRNLYLVSFLLLLGALAGPDGQPLLPLVAYPLALAVLLAALLLPARYTFTDRGVVLGAGVLGAHALFRPWKEFHRYQLGEEQIVLQGRRGRYTSYTILVEKERQREVQRVLKRYLR
jgi:hypothetical protein